MRALDPLKPTSVAGHPALRSAGFGLAAALDALSQAVERRPMVTLVGGPGVGKSRLALERADAAIRSGRPVVYCDATTCTSADELAAAAIRAGGLMSGQGPAVEVVGHAIGAAGPALWVLDNLDLAGEAAAAVLGAWLMQAPEIRWVATSRTPLGLSGEHVQRVEPLPVPTPEMSWEAAMATPALALLLERRSRHAGQLAPPEAERGALAELVRALEGIPLALELAAARLRAVDARSLLDALAREPSRLAGGPGDAPAHHRSMDAAVSWSWGRLSTAQKQALGALSVFRGGFTQTSAAAVLNLDAVDTADLLDALSDHSLLQVTEGPPRRFAPYEVVRSFALRQTPTAHLDAARARHAQTFATQSDAADDPRSTPPNDAARLRALAAEAENLTAALRFSVGRTGQESACHAVACALGLDPLLTIRGPSALLEDVLTTAWAAHARDPVPAPLATRLADALGRHAINRGEVPRAVEWLERAVALARGLPAGPEAQRLLGRALDHLACAEMLRRPAAAEPLLQTALAAARAAGDRAGEGRSLSNLGILRHADGRFDEARNLLEEALVLLRGAGDTLGAANTWSVLGAFYHAAPSQDLARACYGAALETYREVGNVRREAAVTGSLALVEQEAGQYDDAERLFHLAIDRLRKSGANLYASVYTGYLGALAHERGRPLDARIAYREAIAALDAAGERRYAAFFRGCLATCDAAGGQAESAAALRQAADERAAGLGDRMLALALAALVGTGAPEANAAVSYDVRLAARLGLGRASGSSAGPTAAEVLLISRDGCAFRAPGGPVADVGRRLAARRLLLRLAHERETCPGRPLAPDVLFQAGWPGDRSRENAARNRIHVTLAALRQLGLREVLCRRGNGYLLDPAVPIRVVDAI